MTILQSILLGVVQGITEFLPVSSSAHLVLTEHLLGWRIPAEQDFIFNVLVQLGSLVAVILYFRKDLFAIARAFVNGLARRQPFSDPEARMGWYLILATVPAGLAGLLFRTSIEAAFDSTLATALFLLLTGVLLLTAEKIGTRSQSLTHLTWKDALVIGLFQALALFPGVSRSGSTITGGMARHLDRPAAARFSFLMSVPIMLAAGFLSSFELVKIPHLDGFLPPLLAGFFAAAVVGYLAIRWLLGYLAHRPLYLFAVYVVAVSAATLVSLYAGG